MEYLDDTLFVDKARNGMLSPLRFSLAFILGFSITVSIILCIVLTAANGIDLRKIEFVIFVFVVNILIGFPIVNIFSRYFMGKFFSKWSSQLKKEQKGR